ncbi:50S ribosomal protein L5 [Candidatus Woesearchaeota archaeon]|nr:50S ribosomal protein L5 [Candidatus Woesearchaeota archaeon]RLE40874.1 MAG: 50S ribosomal protein L5 [Candidatus Woesearchaeota archaeon]
MENPMREIRIEKVTLNIGSGKNVDALEKAIKLLQKITGAKPVKRVAKKRIPAWDIRPGVPIACIVTLRGKKARQVLGLLLDAKDRMLDAKNFDNGTFSFGIPEYIEIPGMKYDPELGIIGLEVAVTLERRGFRVKRRKLRKRRIGKRHRITKEETIAFAEKELGVRIK